MHLSGPDGRPACGSYSVTGWNENPKTTLDAAEVTCKACGSFPSPAQVAGRTRLNAGDIKIGLRVIVDAYLVRTRDGVNRRREAELFEGGPRLAWVTGASSVAVSWSVSPGLGPNPILGDYGKPPFAYNIIRQSVIRARLGLRGRECLVPLELVWGVSP